MKCMQLHEAEQKLERAFKTHSNVDKGLRGQLVKEESEVIFQRLKRINKLNKQCSRQRLY